MGVPLPGCFLSLHYRSSVPPCFQIGPELRTSSARVHPEPGRQCEAQMKFGPRSCPLRYGERGGGAPASHQPIVAVNRDGATAMAASASTGNAVHRPFWDDRWGLSLFFASDFLRSVGQNDRGDGPGESVDRLVGHGAAASHHTVFPLAACRIWQQAAKKP